MNPTKHCRIPLPALLAAFVCTAPLHAEVALDAVAKGINKTQVTDSMMGLRDTLLFYVFGEEKAVLVVRIDNKNTNFSTSGKLYIFADDTNAEALAKWVNNQHSDGLFADAPEPTTSHEIPAASCKVKGHEVAEKVDAPNGKFSRYMVTFEIKDVPALGGLKLKDFTDKASVNVKVVEG